MSKLNETDRWRAVGMLEAGVRHTDVAKQFGVYFLCTDLPLCLG